MPAHCQCAPVRVLALLPPPPHHELQEERPAHGLQRGQGPEDDAAAQDDVAGPVSLWVWVWVCGGRFCGGADDMVGPVSLSAGRQGVHAGGRAGGCAGVRVP